MSHGIISLGSVYRGLRAMSSKREFFRHWGIYWGRTRFWCHLWTPMWHKGRGPYVTIGLGCVAVCRGY